MDLILATSLGDGIININNAIFRHHLYNNPKLAIAFINKPATKQAIIHELSHEYEYSKRTDNGFKSAINQVLNDKRDYLKSDWHYSHSVERFPNSVSELVPILDQDISPNEKIVLIKNSDIYLSMSESSKKKLLKRVGDYIANGKRN